MKKNKLFSLIILGAMTVLICCKNSQSEQDAVLNTQVTTDSNIVKNIDSNTVSIISESEDLKNEELFEEYKRKYKYTRAKYVEYMMGDVEHFIFISDDGNEFNFSGNNEPSLKLEKRGDINVKLKNKYFDIFYKTEVIDLGTPGPGEQEVDVIYKLFIVK